MYDLETLRNRLLSLAERNFHLLVLINACYGGDIFKSPGTVGGNEDVTDRKGAFIITAGPIGVPVASLGGRSDGSIFFDNLVRGIRSGKADQDYNRLVMENGDLYQFGGLVRLGALDTYLTTEAKLLTNRHIPTADGPLIVDAPWHGPISPKVEDSGGGFFFLAPIQVANMAQRPIDVPPGPISSIPGRPDIKVFKPPQEYGIRGVDVSRYEGDIDWPTVKAAGYAFAYIRATEVSGRKDRRFDEHWQRTRAVGLPHGAYHFYSYCAPIEDQLNAIKAAVKIESDALPLAIVSEIPVNGSEEACKSRLGHAQLVRRIVELGSGVEKYFGKRPIIYGSRTALQEYFGGGPDASPDAALERFMVWLAIWRKADPSSIRLPGRNPWTLWQYSGTTTVPGIGDNVDVSVFFGTRAQFDDFMAGKDNAALAAALVPQK